MWGKTTSTGKVLHRLTGRRGWQADYLAFSPDGQQLVAANEDGAATLWEARTGKRLGVCDGPECSFRSVVFSSNGTPRAWGFKGQTACVWEIPTGKVLTSTAGHDQAIRAIGFPPDGKTVCTVDDEGHLFRWDAVTGKELRQTVLEDELRTRYEYWTHAFSPDARYVLGGSSGVIGWRLWETATARVVCDFHGGTGPTRGNNIAAAFSRDGALLAVATARVASDKSAREIRLWDVANGRLRQEVSGPTTEVDQLALSPDGKYVAGLMFGLDAARDRVAEVKVWEWWGGKVVSHVQQPGSGGTPWVTFTPDGGSFAMIGPDRMIRLRGVASGGTRLLLGDAGQLTVSPLFSPDGRMLAVAGQTLTQDGRAEGTWVKLWEVATGQVREELTGHEGRITALAFSHDGKVLATGSADTTVLLWDLSGRLRNARAGAAPGAKELEELWEGLDSPDAGKAFRAVQRLSQAPGQALPLLKKHLKPSGFTEADERAIKQLIRDLDADDFAVRRKASENLAKFGDAARTTLQEALKANPAAEVKRRIHELLEALQRAGPSRDMLRSIRSLEVLERIGTPETRQLVEALAVGKAGVPLTEEAKATLARMPK